MHSAIWAILAMGMSYVIVGGGIALSVGSVAGLRGMLDFPLFYAPEKG